MDAPTPKTNTFFVIALLISSIIIIANAFYFFYFQKDFDFVVETTCDPLVEACFQRDCSDPDNCPPNGLSDFKRYTVNAGDFSVCEEEDCTLACENGVIECIQIECEEDILMGETCSSPVESSDMEVKKEISEEIVEEVAE